MDTKYVCVIVDDFTGRALELPQRASECDYGQNLSVTAANCLLLRLLHRHSTIRSKHVATQGVTNFDNRAFYASRPVLQPPRESPLQR